MKRDFSLIDTILITMEEDLFNECLDTLNSDMCYDKTPLQKKEEIRYELIIINHHVELLADLDLIKREIQPGNPYNYKYIRLTMKGYDYLDKYRGYKRENIYPMKYFKEYLNVVREKKL